MILFFCNLLIFINSKVNFSVGIKSGKLMEEICSGIFSCVSEASFVALLRLHFPLQCSSGFS